MSHTDPVPAAVPCAAPAPTAAAEPRDCGWLASSLDLRRGAQVTEHADPQAVLDAIPLGWWVDWESWRQGIHRR